MKIRRSKKGFTLVEIMIVVAIIGLLAAIAIPNFVQARQTARTNTCLNNLRLVASAKEQAALALDIASSGTPTAAQLDAYIKGNYTALECPVDGDTGSVAYPLTALNADPTCSNNGSTHVVNGVL